MDLVSLQGKFFPPKFSFVSFLEKEILAGKKTYLAKE
jgi:hypothetical protein